MVNYLYVLDDIEKNHEAYANTGTIATSRTIKNVLKLMPKGRNSGRKKDTVKQPPLAITANGVGNDQG